MSNQVKILHIEDDLFFTKTFQKELQKYGYKNIRHYNNCNDALNLNLVIDPELIFIDHLLENELGANQIQKFKAKFKTSKIIILTSVNNLSLIELAFKNGVDNYLVKNEDLNFQLKSLFK